jgi:RNA polymerase sigma-70 factor (ECF subfamily)
MDSTAKVRSGFGETGGDFDSRLRPPVTGSTGRTAWRAETRRTNPMSSLGRGAGLKSVGETDPRRRPIERSGNDNASAKVVRLRAPDRAAFSADIMTCVPYLQRMARLLAVNAADADDLVQDTLCQALQHSATFVFGSTAQLRCWAAKILRNLHYDRYRKRRREVLTDQFDAIADEHGDGEISGWRMISDEAVEAEVRNLPKHLSDVYRLFVQGLSYTAIASRLAIASGTVGGRIYRARAHLCKALIARYTRASALRVVGQRQSRSGSG